VDVLKIAVRARKHTLAFFAVLLVFGGPSAASADPPLTSQVVDAETGEPIGGAVVLAYWDRCYASPGGWAGCKFHDAEEVVTGPDGRYAIQSRYTYTVPLLMRVDFVAVLIYKPGYECAERRSLDTAELVALRPVKTGKERLRASGCDPGLVPSEYQKRMLEAIRRERAYLGLH
jgi:hypothetical protein